MDPMGSPAWAKIEETNGSGRSGNGIGEGDSQFPTCDPLISPVIIFTLDLVYCSQRIWGKSGSWFICYTVPVD